MYVFITVTEPYVDFIESTKIISDFQYYKQLRNNTNQAIKIEQKAHCDHKIATSSSKANEQFLIF